MLAPAAPPPADALSRSHSLARVLCTQAIAVAVSGSYAYVAGYGCHSLVVIDVSNPASPVIRGSVVSSSLMLHARSVAVSGSYAYVTAVWLDSRVVVDVSNPASPVIRGSVVSSSLLGGVRVRPGASRARHASAPPIVLAPAAPLPADALSRSHSLALTFCAHRL